MDPKASVLPTAPQRPTKKHKRRSEIIGLYATFLSNRPNYHHYLIMSNSLRKYV